MAKCKLSATERKQLEALFTTYDTARAALHDKLEELQDDWQNEYDEGSESWQEGEHGQAAQERLDTIIDLVGAFEEAPDFEPGDL